MEWYGALPERWESKRLSALLENRKEKNDPIQTDFILSLSAKYGVAPYSERKEKGGNKPKGDLTQYNIARKYDLLVNNMNVLAGSSGVTNWDGAISPVYYALHPRDQRANIWYYNYIFRLIVFYRSLIGLGKGILVHESASGSLNTIRLRIPMTSLNSVKLPVPPRDEQDMIVRYLDWKVSSINKLINAKHKQITLLQEQKSTNINDAATKQYNGMKEISLGNLGVFRKGFGGTRADDSDNGAACIRYGDIYRSGTMVLSEPITRISHDKVDSYARIYKPELLFALSGETKDEIGQALVNNIDENVWCSGDAAIFTASSAVLPAFLTYSLRCPYIIHQRASLSKGDIIVHISTGALRRLRVFVPTIKEQKQIVKFLDEICKKIDDLIMKITAEISVLHEYRTRIICDVVTGKLDIRGITIPDYDAVSEITSDKDESLDDGEEVKEDD